ncbi:tRNA (cytidine(34)-2'-O)-methyltransferase [Nodularia spumigena]|uniref:tRNA (cytidine(34)-2'-O)-methyltransferase n=1 Tax=Nodularia spumigena TaxID=70799 RepID=UPI002B217889|nr:tRNA (cytidine(34)-2'-O)-methyltransferase [Nodularia spumigena]MEA5557627.1 tRNA (cytidine(34)-2'-O)-methyltransferase [Nodularia spumigena CH309]
MTNNPTPRQSSTIGLSPEADVFLRPPDSPRLRNPLFHVVLHEPEIPNNTGNIGRTCVATGSRLHLIHPLGFTLSEKACRRAGLDYWPRLDWAEHASWQDYLRAPSSPELPHQQSSSAPRRWFLSTKTDRSIFDVTLQRGDHLVFGKESRGLPPDILASHPDQLVSLPMLVGERSLNLATAVCAVVYEGLRQLRARRLLHLTPQGRLVIE